MNKSLILSTILFTSLIFTLRNSNAQWGPDVRLTNDGGNSYTSNNNTWCVAASGNFVHVVWINSGGSTHQVYYERSTDAGVSWSTDTVLGYDINYHLPLWPSISAAGSVLYVVWVYNYNAFNNAAFDRSTNSGASWGTNALLSYSAEAYYPSISAFGSNVFIMDQERNIQNEMQIYDHPSTNQGLNWGGSIPITNYTYSLTPSVSLSASAIHVVWTDYRDAVLDIYYKRSTDLGATWGSDLRLTSASDTSWYPCVSSSGNVVHAVWQDNRDGNWEIYYKHSTDNGISWGSDVRLTNNPDSSINANITSSGSNVHVVWQDHRDGNWEIYYKLSTDYGNSWSADTRLTNNAAESLYPSVAVSGSQVNVVWTDTRDGSEQIYYKRNASGNPFGISSINTETPKQFALNQNYPNPFNPTTKIGFNLPNPSAGGAMNTRLVIYDALGREIETLVNEELKPGHYEVSFDASNLASGLYFYELTAGSFVETKKMILTK